MVAGGLLAGACQAGGGSKPKAPMCLDFDADTCTPQYAPEWQRVFENTLSMRCAIPGGSCHGSPDGLGAQPDGLYMSDIDSTYDVLLGNGGGKAFVVPGDPNCSPVGVRINAVGTKFLMPTGSLPLPEAERCSIEQWIANGAMQ